MKTVVRSAFFLLMILLCLSCGKPRSLRIVVTTRSNPITYALIKGSGSECAELKALIKNGVTSPERFSEFETKRRALIQNAASTTGLKTMGSNGGHLEVSESIDYIVFFVLDKSGIWLFEIEEVVPTSSEIIVGDDPTLDLRKFLFN